jgi:hypothetical protein
MLNWAHTESPAFDQCEMKFSISASAWLTFMAPGSQPKAIFPGANS